MGDAVGHTPETYGSQVPAELLEHASEKLNLPHSHPAVLEHAKTLIELRDKEDQITDLRLQLDEAQKDSLTGFWLYGPGISKLEQLMSTIENNLAGLGDNDENAPNALLAIGMDVEALHYTNNSYGQQGGNTRLILAGQELRETAQIIRQSARTSDRRSLTREDEVIREPDLLIRIGGDEFLAAMPFRETEANTREVMAQRITQRLSRHRIENVPDLRLLYRIGFFVPGIGQTAEDLYNSADPKAEMNRRQRLARPIFKIVRHGLGQYKPPTTGRL